MPAILAALAEHPQVFARCSSEFPFFPAMQLLIRWIREERFGRILEIKAGFCHSSDMDVNKPINWKRKAAINGEYGCLGDLGIHTEHVPFRMGFIPQNGPAPSWANSSPSARTAKAAWRPATPGTTAR